MLLANANSVATSYFPRSYGLLESRQDCYLFPAIKKKKSFSSSSASLTALEIRFQQLHIQMAPQIYTQYYLLLLNII